MMLERDSATATPPERELDDPCRLAASACAAPMAHLVFLTTGQVRLPSSSHGLEARHASQLASLCEIALRADGVLTVQDATADARIARHALVTGAPHIRFFAGVPVRGSSGRPVGVLAVMDTNVRTITDEQANALSALAARVMTTLQSTRTMDALLESERQHRLLFEQNPIAIGVWRLGDRKIVAANDAMATLYGYSREELLRMTVDDVFAPDDQPRLDKRLTVMGPDGRLQETWKHRRKDGAIIFVESTGSPIEFDGAPSRMVQMRDVSMRVRIKADLQRERAALDGVLESAEDGIFTVDREWRLTHINAAGERLFGIARNQLVGRTLWEAIPKTIGATFEAALKEVMATGIAVAAEDRMGTTDSWFEMRAFAWSDGLAVHFRDCTERRRRTSAIRDLTAGLDKAGSADFFDELVSRLTATLQATGVFVGEFAGTPPETFHTISLFREGAFRDLVDHPLVCTPCTELLHDETCAVLGDLKKRYADNPFVHVWDVNSYLGVALRRPDGAAVGLIAAVYRNPVQEPDAAMNVLRLFALRAAAELERRRSLHRLHTSEERFKLLAQTTNDALWDWDLSTQSMWWSEGFEKLFGYTRAEIEPDITSWTNRVHPDDRERVVQGIQAAIDGQRDHWVDEYRFLRKDGGFAYVLDRGFVVRDAAGRGVRMVGGMTDMTDRLRAEQQLREQAELLDRASDGIYVRGLDNRIRYWNRGAERIYGWTPAQSIGRDVRALLREEAGEFAHATSQVVSRGEWSGEIRHRDSRNKEITVHARWTLLRDPSGEPRAILAIDTDVTEKKRIEAQFLRAQRLESIGILAGGIAHDLNNMLTPITMAVDMLKRVHQDDDSTALVEAIESSARRGADLVRQVMGFTRGVEGRKLDVNPNFLARDIAKIARETFPKNIRIITELPLEPWLVRSDPTQLHQILLNLCINARDAMPVGGEITISVENTRVDAHFAGMDEMAAPGNYITISVKDTGTGIPEEIRDKIFDPFFTTKEPGKGTGLGLSTVLGIVKSHGGWINLYSEMDQGSTFRVYLPAVAGSAPPAAERIEVSLPRGHGECVLVVDDEAAIRTISKQTLEAFGYQVLTASDGAEGLAIYVQNTGHVALVLTDMMMPIMDGPALIRALLRVDPSARIVAASGLNAEGMVAKAAEAGVTHFLPKPYTAETMLKSIDAILRPAAVE